MERDDAARIAASDALSALFDDALTHYDRPESVAKWLVNELQRVAKGGALDDLPFGADAFARLVELADGDTLSNRAAKEVFEAMLAGEGAPDTIVAARGLEQVSDRDRPRADPGAPARPTTPTRSPPTGAASGGCSASSWVR